METLSALKERAVAAAASAAGAVMGATGGLDAANLASVTRLARQLRVDSIRCTDAARSGHATSSMSTADAMAVLQLCFLRRDFSKTSIAQDRLVFSKGHAAPLLYAMMKAAGAVTDEQLISLRKLHSTLEGHPNPRTLPLVEVATGSLGQGLGIAVGEALAVKRIHDIPTRVFVLLGDSECAEGSVWEAANTAGHYHLDNITAIVDVNRLGQSTETMLGWDVDTYAARFRAFGWHAVVVGDGHDVQSLYRAFAEAVAVVGKPSVIVAKTVKGKGVPAVEDKEGWHGKALDAEVAAAAIEHLGGVTNEVFKGPPLLHLPGHKLLEGPAGTSMHLKLPQLQPSTAMHLPTWRLGEKVATRKAYGAALAAIGAVQPRMVALDAEVSNSTGSETFHKAVATRDRFFEMFIAEQQMIEAGVGFAVSGCLPFVSTFACFLTRAFDQLRMAAVTDAHLCVVGSHAGVSIGEDGPSQMGLEDIAMMRALHGSTVLYPCDANQTAALVASMAHSASGIHYLRTTRGDTHVLYGADETFPVGGSKVLRKSSEDVAVIAAAGITVHEALAAAAILAGEQEGASAAAGSSTATGTAAGGSSGGRLQVRVMDLYSIKPLDVEGLLANVREAGGVLVTVEDHWPQGGLGEACCSAIFQAGVSTTGRSSVGTASAGSGTAAAGTGIAVKCLAVSKMVGSGTPAELLAEAGIDRHAIVRAVREAVRGR